MSDLQGQRKPGEGLFFTASTPKLLLMAAFTFGIYNLYWFYRNWKSYAPHMDKKIKPFWRATFAPIYAFGLFKIIKKEADQLGVMNDLRPVVLGIVYFLFSGTWDVPEPFWLVSYFSFIPVAIVNAAALEINQKAVPGFVENDKFKGWNWVALVLGGFVFLMGIADAFLPDHIS